MEGGNESVETSAKSIHNVLILTIATRSHLFGSDWKNTSCYMTKMPANIKTQLTEKKRKRPKILICFVNHSLKLQNDLSPTPTFSSSSSQGPFHSSLSSCVHSSLHVHTCQIFIPTPRKERKMFTRPKSA